MKSYINAFFLASFRHDLTVNSIRPVCFSHIRTRANWPPNWPLLPCHVGFPAYGFKNYG